MTSVIVGCKRMLNLMPWRNGKLTSLKLLILIFHFTLIIYIFYPLNLNLLFRRLKRDTQGFDMNYVLVSADKADNNLVVVWRLFYINTLKRELVDTNVYKLQPSLSEMGMVVIQPYILVSKLKKTKIKWLHSTGYLNSIKTYNARFMLILVLVWQLNFLNC